MVDHSKLSKETSYALRYAPWEYELEMNEKGLLPKGRQYVHMSQSVLPVVLGMVIEGTLIGGK